MGRHTMRVVRDDGAELFNATIPTDELIPTAARIGALIHRPSDLHKQPCTPRRGVHRIDLNPQETT